MTTQFFKTILAGILAGIALFMFPFVLLRVLFFFLIIGAIFRLLRGPRQRGFRGRHYAFAQHYANMSEEEKTNFKARYGGRCCYTPFEESSSTTQNSKTN
jgi:hypothetical protein